MKNIKKTLFERNGDSCSICGEKLTFENAYIEHIFPLSLGGTRDLSNLRLLCRNCNNKYVNTSFNEHEFVKFICEVMLKNNNFRNIKLEAKIEKNYSIDILAERKKSTDWEMLAIEVKYTTSLTIDRIYSIIARMKEIKKIINTKCVLLLPGKLTEKASLLLNENNIEVWDEEYLVSNFQKEIEKINHPIFSSILNTDYKYPQNKEQVFIDKLKKCESGREHWVEYQKLIGEILSFLFCPPLLAPLTEKTDAFKVNRRDFIFPNYCDTGFWAFLRSRYSADYIVIDAKNYSQKVTKKEVLQIANYLKYHGTGLFAIIITRNGISESALYTLREVWSLENKLIIILQDNDIEQMLIEKLSNREPETIIRQKIEDFRLSL